MKGFDDMIKKYTCGTPINTEAVIKTPEDFKPDDLPDKVKAERRDGAWVISAEGKAVHAQHPEQGENAIGRLFKYLCTLPFSGDTADAIGFIADKIGMDTTGALLGCDLYDEISGHTSLNMADISDDLSVVHRHIRKLEISKRQGGDINNPVLPQYQKDIQKADDTDLVAGIAANRVAVAESTAERTTIRNARLHDGHAWSEVMTKRDGDSLTGRTNTAIANYSKDIEDLRDEVYQIRMELAKSGVTAGYKPYAGFYDLFREHQPMHEAEVMATAIDNSATQYKIKIEDLAFDSFFVGDKILIKSLVNGETALVTIQNKEPDGRTLTLDRATGFDILKDKAVVYKSKGHIINGTYTFGEITPERPGKKEMYTCLDDDTFRLRRRISKKKTGFAYTFRIAEPLQKNYLAKLDVQVKKFGNPGALMCYVIDERDMPRWKNAAQAIADNDRNSADYGTTKYNFFAKSQPLIVDANMGEHLAHFTFYDPTAGELVPIEAADLSAAEYATLTAVFF